MQLHKTERARAELKPGVRTLGQRERTLLLLADGSKSMQDFRPLFDGGGEQIALRLVRDGYLQTQAATSAGRQEAPAVNAGEITMSTPASPVTASPAFSIGRLLQGGGTAVTAPARQVAATPLQFRADSHPAVPSHFNERSPETTQGLKVSADQFEGKRSLATTRMFLFDICERMFARRDPSKANLFRDALRSAKDRETMLAVSRDMIDEIEKVAGHERADSISERLAMLLPSEFSADVAS